MSQEVVLLVSLALMAVVGGAFIYVAANASGSSMAYEPVQKRSYRLRSGFFWTLLFTGIIVLVISTLDLPFAATRGQNVRADRVIDVEGRQWYWDLSEQQVELGETVVFNVNTIDVNHGLGIYDPTIRLLGQTQAMPGYTNRLVVTFDAPGRHKLMCMEYCGMAHHGMVADIFVNAPRGEVQ